MSNKNSSVIIIAVISLVILLVGGIGGGIYFFNDTTSAQPKIEETSSDGQATVLATFYDKDGNPISSGLEQSILGSSFTLVEYISFEVKASNTGTIDLTDVQVDQTNSNLADAFDNDGNPPTIATLTTGQSQILIGSTANSCTDNTQCDSNEQCVSNQCIISFSQFEAQAQPTLFTLNIKGTFNDALANPQILSSADVSLSYEILPEECIDATPINTCNLNSQPTYCEFVEGSAPTLIDMASICGCPAGFDISGETCVPQTCSDGTTADTFSVNYDSLSQTRLYCTSSKVLQEQCNNAETTLGGGDSNYADAQACQLDYYGNPAIGCTPSSGEPSTCVYTDYSGQAGLTGGISQG